MMASEATSELKSVTSITYISMCTHGMFYKGHLYKGYIVHCCLWGRPDCTFQGMPCRMGKFTCFTIGKYLESTAKDTPPQGDEMLCCQAKDTQHLRCFVMGRTRILELEFEKSEKEISQESNHRSQE